jgi:DNA-directed RNA polymerase subunit E'/Rpb7
MAMATITTNPTNPTKQFKNKRANFVESIYTRCLITRTISISINNIGTNLEKVLEEYIAFTFEGKCIVEGFVKSDTTKIVTYSSGLVQGLNIIFEVVFECSVCFPVEGMNIYCVAKNITKAGIRAESSTDQPSPFVVFIARDHHFNMPKFATIKEGDKFIANVIGQRFELNDKYISIIAQLKDVKYIEPKFSNRPPVKGNVDC